MTLNFIVTLLLVACSPSERSTVNGPPSHNQWDELLKKHVKADGLVDYKGILSERDKLDAYLLLLNENAPDKNKWPKNEQLAYWINTYNAFTVKLIIDNYPISSIKDLQPSLSIPRVNTIWQKKFFKVGDKPTSLDEIEHDILRKEFNDARIHFAINCASISCPNLRAEAYQAGKIDKQLEDQAFKFINDSTRNKLDPQNPAMSNIFSWFKGDFTENGTLIDFLNQYAGTKIEAGADIYFLEYDWNLNDAK